MSSRTSLHYSWIILAIGILAIFGSIGLARFGYTMLLPSMQTGLHLDNTQAGILATANLIGYLVLSVIGGALASRFGPRWVISVGLLLAGLGMLFTGLANSFLTAVLWRGLTGVGTGASNVPVMALMSAWFSQKRRGLANGIVVTGASLALILLGPITPWILATFGDQGWRTSWCLLGGVTTTLALLSWILIRDRPEEMELKPSGYNPQEPPPQDHWQKPDWRSVYRSPAVWHLGLVYVAFGFSYIIFMTFFTKRLIADGGYTQAGAGQLFMLMGWFSLLCGLIWGTVSDLIGRKGALIIVYLIHAVVFSLFGLWPTRMGFTIAAILFGLSAWSIPAIMSAACGDILGPQMAHAALGFITLFFGIGQAVGPGVAGALADATSNFDSAFFLAGSIALLGAIASAFLRPTSTTNIGEQHGTYPG
jgi:sugar phosphate permease